MKPYGVAVCYVGLQPRQRRKVGSPWREPWVRVRHRHAEPCRGERMEFSMSQVGETRVAFVSGHFFAARESYQPHTGPTPRIVLRQHTDRYLLTEKVYRVQEDDEKVDVESPVSDLEENPPSAAERKDGRQAARFLS